MGNLIETNSKTTRGDQYNSETKSRYKYNTKKQVIQEEVLRDNKDKYTYITIYDSQNRKIKYDMVNSKGISTSIWLYKYNPKNQLNYKIDLYSFDEEKKIEAVESAPPPPPKENK